jgi:hypothetical protein
MPALALPRPPQTVPSEFPFDRWADSPPAQGFEGRKVREVAEQVLRQWNARAESLIAATENAENDSYVSVPPNRVFYVKTRYVYSGQGTPRAFGLDDER